MLKDGLNCINIEKVNEILLADRRVCIQRISNEVKISTEVVGRDPP